MFTHMLTQIPQPVPSPFRADILGSHALYCDGGVILRNPSTLGGTWAVRHVVDGHVIQEAGGTITPVQMCAAEVTNNQTELLALVRGLEMLPSDWTGTVYSDSECTLGRAFLGWKWNNIPLWLHHRYQAARARLIHWTSEPPIRFVLLDGHPTRAQLAAGKGKRGRPVSEHQAWCDRRCQEEARQFMAAAPGHPGRRA